MELPWLKFKVDGPEATLLRLRKEFGESDPRLRALCFEVGYWQYELWGIPLTITRIGRTLEEAMGYGRIMTAHRRKDGERYYRAMDWRNRDLEPEGREARRRYIINHFNHGVPLLYHVLDHNSGQGDHTHININFPYLL